MCPARYRRHHGHRYVHTAARTCTSFPSSVASSPASSWSLSVASLRAHSHRFNLPKSVERTSHTHRLYTTIRRRSAVPRATIYPQSSSDSSEPVHSLCRSVSAYGRCIAFSRVLLFISAQTHTHTLTRQIMDNYSACGVCVSGLE